MKSTLRMMALAATLATGSLANASQTYDFSYGYIDSNFFTNAVTGSFTGDPSGNLITNLSGISVSLNGFAFNGPLFGSHWDGSAWISGGAIASFDGTENNLMFIDCDYPSSCSGITNYFYAVPATAGNSTDSSYLFSVDQSFNEYESEAYSALRWSVTQQGTVPEPGSLALAAIALLGLAASRKKNQA